MSATLPIARYNRCQCFRRECELYRYCMLFDHRNWLLLTYGWSFDLFVLINTHLDKYQWWVLFISMQNWRTLCTCYPIHCAGAQFTHSKRIDIQLTQPRWHSGRAAMPVVAGQWSIMVSFSGNWEITRSPRPLYSHVSTDVVAIRLNWPIFRHLSMTLSSAQGIRGMIKKITRRDRSDLAY